MPLYLCHHCAHEWEGSSKDVTCDWCGEKGVVLEKLTPLEKMSIDANNFVNWLLEFTKNRSKD